MKTELTITKSGKRVKFRDNIEKNINFKEREYYERRSPNNIYYDCLKFEFLVKLYNRYSGKILSDEYIADLHLTEMKYEDLEQFYAIVDKWFVDLDGETKRKYLYDVMGI